MVNITASYSSALIIGPAWVGDMVMAQVLFKYLRQLSSQLTIDVVAPPWSIPLLERMPEVSRALLLEVQHGKLNLRKRWQLAKSLGTQTKHKQTTSYDVALVLPNSLKAALLPWFAGIKHRIGWRGELRYGLLNDLRYLDKTRYPRTVDRFVALAREANAPPAETLPNPSLTVSQANQQRLIKHFQLNTQQPIIALCPGAQYSHTKQWPIEYYAKVASAMVEKGWQVWIFGTARELPLAQHLQDLLPAKNKSGCHIMCGKLALLDTLDLLALSQMVLSNDSGLMHIAAALDKAVAVIYGSTSPTMTPPLCQHARELFVELDCRPCMKRQCRFGHLKCLWELHPEGVINALEQLMDSVSLSHHQPLKVTS